jgi:vacuolar-type H+-ATPase subunit I/STV1
MRPNFEEMTSAELRAYALAHRDDIEPLRVLYSRRSPDSEATWYGPLCTPEGVPIEENIRIAEEAIRQRAEKDREKQREKELQKERELEERLRQKIEQEVQERLRREIQQEWVSSEKDNMTTVTQEEIEQFREQLRDYPGALVDLEVIERCEGDLERAARVLARRSGVEEVRSGANWQLALQKARELVCDDKFKDGLAPGLIGGLIGTLAASGSPILVAVATPVAIYITQVSIEAFCKSQKSASEDEENPS